MHLLTLGFWLVASEAKGDLIGMFNLKSVDTEMCCLGDDNLVSCDNECPPLDDKYFYLFKEGLKYTFACPDKKSWVSLSPPDKFSSGRTWKCAKQEPTPFEVRLASKNIHQQNEYVILMADGSGACNMEPEFFRRPETKIECHKDIPKGHVEAAFKWLFLDDVGNACNYCGEYDSGKNPEQLEKIQEMREKLQKATKRREAAAEKARKEAAARRAKARNATAGGCGPCECDINTIKKGLSGLIVWDNSSPTHKKAEESAASPIAGWVDYKFTTFVLLTSHVFWICAYFKFWRTSDECTSQTFTEELLEEDL